MKVLLDHNLDRRPRHSLSGHEVKTTYEMGWAELLNGELLDRASDEFDVLLTADANIRHQQSLKSRTIAVVVLRARDNRRATHATMMATVGEVLRTIPPGQLVEVVHEDLEPGRA